MNEYQNILNIIFEAIDEFNQFQQTDQILDKSANTILFNRSGFTEKGVLDSLGLINFLVIVETKIKQKINSNFNLNIADFLENKEETLKNINSLINIIMKNSDESLNT